MEETTIKTGAIVQFVGYKNSGKTTLMCRMAKELSSLGYRVGAIKHDSHDFEMDRAGTDTWCLDAAGACKVAITSPYRTVVSERRSRSLDELAGMMKGTDVVLTEGFKQEGYPKFVMIRGAEDIPLLDACSNVIAAVSWVPFEHGLLPVFGIEDKESVLELLLKAVSRSG